MDIMQDVSLQGSSADVDSTDALDSTQENGDSGQAAASQGSANPTQATPRTVDVTRFNTLMANHQKVLGDYRSAKEQLEKLTQTSSQWETREKELIERLERLEGGRQGTAPKAAPAGGKMDFTGMSPDEIVEYLAQQSEERAYQRYTNEQKKASEAREAEEQKKLQAEEKKWFQSNWDQVFAEDPAVDVDALEKFMKEERIFNPKKAYALMNSEKTVQAAVQKGKKEAVQKVVSNKQNFTEGSGQAGIKAPEKPSLGTKKERQSFIGKRLAEMMADGVNF